jgi:chromosomal replication initiator protein
LCNIEQRINKQSFATWFRPIFCQGGDSRSLQLAVPSKFHLDWVNDHYLSVIKEQLSLLCDRDISVEIDVAPELAARPVEVVSPEGDEAPAAPIHMSEATRPSTLGRRLNERYTFETFVGGPSNQFAYAACQAVADKPARAYNPLFIYGGVGLGKTHLLHAIGLSMLERDPATKIIYVSTEEFMNDLIDSIRHEKMDAFRARYRSRCDVLLIDDIQFLGAKDRTQEEFFHTFNYLYESQRQIVITSDKVPHEIPGIEERLRTRFQCGLIADIQAPEMETRIAILQTKAESDHIDLPDDVAMYLATNIKSNVRELEGSLIRLQAFASMYRKPITLDIAKEQLQGLVHSEQKALTAEHVQKIVASYFGLKSADLRGQKRQRAISQPRQIAMYLARKHCGLSFPEIGERFGGKDHTTVMSAVRKIEAALESDPSTKKAVDALESTLLA